MPLTCLTCTTDTSSTFTIKGTSTIVKITAKAIEDTIYNPITNISGCLCYFYDNQQGRLGIVITQWGSESLTRMMLSCYQFSLGNILLNEDPTLVIPDFTQAPKAKG